MEQLLALASEVKKYRERLVRDKGLLSDAQLRFNAQHTELLAAIGTGNTLLQSAESDLRKATVAAYLADPNHNKNVLPGVVSIRDNIVFGYDTEKAFAFAKEHGVALLLDTKTYEKLIKAGVARGTMVTEPQATIAREIKLPQVVEK